MFLRKDWFSWLTAVVIDYQDILYYMHLIKCICKGEDILILLLVLVCI